MNTLDFNLRPKLAAHVRLKIDPVTGEAVLLFPEGLLILNETAHEIARRCDGQTSISKLAEDLAGEFDADKDLLLEDIRDNLEQLRQRNLLIFSP
ncbi:MAG TPA: pyrroloquinoline quinone biosynthesis peptide chaperone PqqD [Candidatus Methylacidiphilales bacterium]